MESDLPKGYRGAAERSSNVGVPAFPYVGVPAFPSRSCAAERSSEVGVPECAYPNGSIRVRVQIGGRRHAFLDGGLPPFIHQSAPLMPLDETTRQCSGILNQ